MSEQQSVAEFWTPERLAEAETLAAEIRAKTIIEYIGGAIGNPDRDQIPIAFVGLYRACKTILVELREKVSHHLDVTEVNEN